MKLGGALLDLAITSNKEPVTRNTPYQNAEEFALLEYRRLIAKTTDDR